MIIYSIKGMHTAVACLKASLAEFHISVKTTRAQQILAQMWGHSNYNSLIHSTPFRVHRSSYSRDSLRYELDKRFVQGITDSTVMDIYHRFCFLISSVEDSAHMITDHEDHAFLMLNAQMEVDPDSSNDEDDEDFISIGESKILAQTQYEAGRRFGSSLLRRTRSVEGEPKVA